MCRRNLFAICVSAALLFDGVDATAADATLDPELLPVHRDTVRSFLEALPKEYEAERISKPRWGRIGPLPSIAVSIRGGGPFMELDAKAGTVYFFRDLSPLYAGEKAEEPIDTVMTADEALLLARPLLQHYGLPIVQEQYSIEPASSIPNNVAQGMWRISKELSYNGMESVGSRVRIGVRAYTHRVEVVAYHPPVPPAPVKNPISKEEAIERARAILLGDSESTHRNIVMGEASDVTKVISMPPSYRNLRPDRHPYSSRHFWKVPYSAEFLDDDWIVPFSPETLDDEMGTWKAYSYRVLVCIETGKDIAEVTTP